MSFAELLLTLDIVERFLGIWYALLLDYCRLVICNLCLDLAVDFEVFGRTKMLPAWCKKAFLYDKLCE